MVGFHLVALVLRVLLLCKLAHCTQICFEYAFPTLYLLVLLIHTVHAEG